MSMKEYDGFAINLLHELITNTLGSLKGPIV